MKLQTEPTIIATQTRKSAAWTQFQKKLAITLAKLNEDQFLILSLKHSNCFVQFAAQGPFGMRIETTSNQYLKKQEQLDSKQVRALEVLGWLDPTGTHRDSTPEADPEGSPNFYREFSMPVSFASVAELAIKTLSKVIRVLHPGLLEYSAFDTQGNQTDCPELGLRRAAIAAAPQELKESSSKLLATIQQLTGFSDLAFDEDGDIMTRYGNALIFGQLFGDPIYVRFYSPLLREVEESTELFERLNDMNVNETSMRFVFQNGVIYALAETVGVPFVSAHVEQTFKRFCMVADRLSGQLQNEFGGLTSFTVTVAANKLH